MKVGGGNGDLPQPLWPQLPSGSMVTYQRGELGVDPFDNLGGASHHRALELFGARSGGADAGLHVLLVQTQKGWLEKLRLAEGRGGAAPADDNGSDRAATPTTGIWPKASGRS